MVLATPHYPPNAKTPRFGIRNHPKHTTHELQHTAGTTSPSTTPWEFAGVVWEVACSSEKPEWAHDTAKNGGQRREWHLGRSWWSLPWHVGLLGSRALTRRSSPTKPAKLNDAKKSISDETQSIFGSSYLVALWMGVSRGLRTW